MALPAFGFSAGDFIAGLTLIAQVSSALKDAGGAAKEYQGTVAELEAFGSIIEHIKGLKVPEHNLPYINAVRGIALTCHPPLEEFLTRMEKFRKSLEEGTTRSKFMTAPRKAQWSVFMSGEIPKLRAVIGSRMLKIQVLLELNIM
jgi:hypothetical protein